MHIIIEDQENGTTSIVCVERRTKTCVFLNAEPEHIETLLQTAQAVGAEDVVVLAYPQWAEKHLEHRGFKARSDLVVYEKELK